MKATVVLFFFLGMNSLLFCINPKDQGIYEDAYMVTNAILKGSQVCRTTKGRRGRTLKKPSVSSGKHRLHLLLRPLQRREDGGEEEVVPVEGEEGPRQGPAEAGREADIVEFFTTRLNHSIY